MEAILNKQITAQLALGLLDWNRKHLVQGVALTEAIIAEKFAIQFLVKANGRVHPANHTSYLAFLNGFRSTIHSIDYDVQDVVAEGNSAVLAMTARVVRLDETVDRFEAMLLLKFDEADLVTLWHEVYLKTQ
ncbi:hypothetical protein HED63_03820 [Ochrobactrum cytisi]|uniref:SnoaL-like domain-containing protein n=1 Tax=Brucella cytisi TaxID=407152 RepID=A0A1J6IF92_9HYPH|nr:hypothetical protein [Brucella cytisi]OIS93760.1 hypothetical protein BLA27_08745 [Brucella cytisi]